MSSSTRSPTVQQMTQAIAQALQQSLPSAADNAAAVAQAVQAVIPDANNQAQIIANAVQNAIQAVQPQSQAAPIATYASPYDVPDVLDLTSKNGATLYANAIKELPLPSKYSGKPQELRPFITHLRMRAQDCSWSNILVIDKNGETLNLLHDYGRLDQADIDAARTERDGAQITTRQKQNARMMYECIRNSINGYILNKVSESATHRDGPSLFYAIIKASHTTTFSHLHHARSTLQAINPKTYSYDIEQTNQAIMAIYEAQDASTNGLSDDEKLFYLFQAYQRIQLPAEWSSFVTSLKTELDRGNPLSPLELMNAAEGKYHRLKDNNQWKPSDKSMAEEFVSMLSKVAKDKKNSNPIINSSRGSKQNKKDKQKGDKNNSPQRKPLPFKDEHGKEGDQREFDGKTFHWCDGNHPKRGPGWGTHEPNDCFAKKDKTNKASKNNKPSNKANNSDKKQAMISVLENALDQEEIDVRNLADALAALYQE